MSSEETRENMWAARGATSVEADASRDIKQRTAELLTLILEKNSVQNEDIVSIVFTATPDLVSDFPAVAAREIGLSDVPLLCSQEIPVEGSLSRCIRVLIHFWTAKRREDIRHVYLHGAKQLRLDLPE